jgi:hypothetical protein
MTKATSTPSVALETAPADTKRADPTFQPGKLWFDGLSAEGIKEALAEFTAEYETALRKLAEQYDAQTEIIELLKSRPQDFTVEIVVRHNGGKDKNVYTSEAPVSADRFEEELASLSRQARSAVNAYYGKIGGAMATRDKFERAIRERHQDLMRTQHRAREALEAAEARAQGHRPAAELTKRKGEDLPASPPPARARKLTERLFGASA